MSTITLPSRFNGPPNSANGGYAAGRAAALVGEPCTATLRAPPPLDTPLAIRQTPEGVELLDGDTIVIDARPRERLAPPDAAPIALETARTRAAHFDAAAHLLPTCFVCGPGRAPGDGLRIFAAAEPGEPLVADVWTPSADLAGEDGAVRPEFVWAALDCPGYFALGIGMALLGRLSVDILEPLEPGAAHVVVGWPRGSDGRKHHSGTAVFTADGALAAHGVATWIELKAPPPGAATM